MVAHESPDDISPPTQRVRDVSGMASVLSSIKVDTSYLQAGTAVANMASALSSIKVDTSYLQAGTAVANMASALSSIKVDTSYLQAGTAVANMASALSSIKVDTSYLQAGTAVANMASALSSIKVDTSYLQAGTAVANMASALSSIKVDTSYLQAGTAVANMASALSSIKVDTSYLLSSSETQKLLVDPEFLKELDEIFSQLPEGEALLAEASDDLKLLISFDHNETVRTMLQLIVVLSLFSVLVVAYSITPWAALASAFGTPSVVASWKATGKGYDRLYGIKDYHPKKALEKGFLPPSGRNRRPERFP